MALWNDNAREERVQAQGMCASSGHHNGSRRCVYSPFCGAVMWRRSNACRQTKKAREDKLRAPNSIILPKGEDYIEAAEAADEAAPAAAVAADEAESADIEAPEAAELAIEAELSAIEAELSAEAESEEDESAAWLQAERVRTAPATAAARTILRMYGIP